MDHHLHTVEEHLPEPGRPWTMFIGVCSCGRRSPRQMNRHDAVRSQQLHAAALWGVEQRPKAPRL